MLLLSWLAVTTLWSATRAIDSDGALNYQQIDKFQHQSKLLASSPGSPLFSMHVTKEGEPGTRNHVRGE